MTNIKLNFKQHVDCTKHPPHISCIKVNRERHHFSNNSKIDYRSVAGQLPRYLTKKAENRINGYRYNVTNLPAVGALGILVYLQKQ